MTKNQIDYWKNQIASEQLDIERSKVDLTRELQEETTKKLRADTDAIRQQLKFNEQIQVHRVNQAYWEAKNEHFKFGDSVTKALPVVGALYKTLNGDLLGTASNVATNAVPKVISLFK